MRIALPAHHLPSRIILVRDNQIMQRVILESDGYRKAGAIVCTHHAPHADVLRVDI